MVNSALFPYFIHRREEVSWLIFYGYHGWIHWICIEWNHWHKSSWILCKKASPIIPWYRFLSSQLALKSHSIVLFNTITHSFRNGMFVLHVATLIPVFRAEPVSWVWKGKNDAFALLFGSTPKILFNKMKNFTKQQDSSRHLSVYL